MSTLSTHVLDTSRGKPAEGVPVRLEEAAGPDRWKVLAETATDADGRVKNLLGAGRTEIGKGTYRLTFDTKAYFEKRGENGFYPYAQIVFEVREDQSHYHVPLLLSGWGYSTYRGS